MKAVIASMMLSAAVIALPGIVHAAAADQGMRTSTKHVKVIRHHRMTYVAPRGAYARVRSPNDVYVYGEYAGSDPDPRIRETIRQEYLRDYLAH